ncbi:hypothetical protein GpartN1_g7316.t1 [Galdieria partita]|uniref:Uncharacterized protein n=1 Tax=Galdieria partita TaxID=83374 RepID=A0A9C7Q489_9RHOD|nr:hypothetical protein GpartN1_g7316.t1 [Galdieria partita]
MTITAYFISNCCWTGQIICYKSKSSRRFIACGVWPQFLFLRRPSLPSSKLFVFASQPNPSSSSPDGTSFRIGNIFSQMIQLLLGFRRLTRLVDDEDVAPLEDVYYPETDEWSRNYQVLVLGATGRIGNIITKKLLLRGYRVRVLVRNLYSSTLDAVGTGCTFAKGDVRELSSLYDAMENVDKVIWAVGASDSKETESVEFNGLQNVIKALHDSKFQQYGSEESSKVTLFKFDRKTDFESWKPVLDEFRSRLASVGLQKRPPKIEYMQNARNNAVFTGKIFDADGGTAEIASKIDQYDLEEFEGLIIRCIGDGKTYGLELRTRSGDNAQVEYLARFRTVPNKWLTIRLPFSKFVAVPKEGILRPVRVTEEINLSEVYQLAINFVKASKQDQDDGFYLAIDYIKAYRKQQEPEFIMISCTDVGKFLRPEKLKELTDDIPIVWKLRGEIALRNSGLTYCIIRSGKCIDRPGGLKPTIVDQELIQDDKYISHADLADVVLHSLNNRKACNVTFNAYESSREREHVSPKQFVATDISASLEQLRANT